MPNSELIFLTATVRVDIGNTRVKLNNFHDRLESVVSATNSWINFAEATNRDLVIIENSGSLNLVRERLKDVSERFLSLIEAPLDTKSINEGISAGEYGMIKYLIDSQPIDKYQFIWKISGRNYCPNAGRVLCWDGEADIVASRNSWPAHFVNSRLFGMRPEMWRDFTKGEIIFSTEEEINTPRTFRSMEHYLTQFVLDQEVRQKRQADFPQIPRFTGHSGSTNKLIDNGKRRLILMLINPIRKIIIKLLMGMTP